MGIEENKYVLEQVNMWIASADNKIGVAIALMSAVLALITFVADSFFEDVVISSNANGDFLSAFYWTSVITILLYVLSIICYISTVVPRFDGTQKNKTTDKYSIYYDEIRKFKSANDYLSVEKDADIEDLNDEIVREIFYNSEICSKKMRSFKLGVLLSAICVFGAILATVQYYCYAFGV